MTTLDELERAKIALDSGSQWEDSGRLDHASLRQQTAIAHALISIAETLQKINEKMDKITGEEGVIKTHTL